MTSSVVVELLSSKVNKLKHIIVIKTPIVSMSKFTLKLLADKMNRRKGACTWEGDSVRGMVESIIKDLNKKKAYWRY